LERAESVVVYGYWYRLLLFQMPYILNTILYCYFYCLLLLIVMMIYFT